MDELTPPLLCVRGLTTTFHLLPGSFPVVDHVDLTIESGETLCLVGESGCGKSMAALSILGLAPDPPAEVTKGEILFKGKDLRLLPRSELRDVRGRDIAMVFQEPSTALNPVHTVGAQVGEVLRVKRRMPRREVRAEVVSLLRRVGIPDPETRLSAYPHQLSGGMRQRVVIAMAVACNPALLIADEPTTALDVTVQAQVLALLARMKEELHMGLLLITHDLGLVAEVAQRVAVMYAGRIVEQATVEALFALPRHPYTRLLLRSRPLYDGGGERRLPTIAGMVPGVMRRPAGCAFAPRCPRAREQCRQDVPPLAPAVPGHGVACLFPHEEPVDG